MASTADGERCVPCEDGRRLLLAALILRVGWAVAARRFWGYHDDGSYDDGVFMEIARGFIGRGTVFPTHPPGFSLFVAPFLLLGDTLGASLALWTQLLISAGTAVLTYRLALNVRLSRAAALIAGLFVALHPMLVFFSARMMSESLFVALVLGFLLAWLYAWQSGRLAPAALAGVLGAAGSLTRAELLPFGGVLALVALWKRREQTRWKELVVVCGLTWAAAMAPWTARNWIVQHRFIPVSVQGGWNFYEGLTVDPDEIRYKRAADMTAEVRALGLTDASAADAHFAAKAKAWIRENPGAFVRLCAVKAVRFWRVAPEPPHSLWVRLAAGLFTGLLFLAAALGLRGASPGPGVWFLYAWVLHLNLLHAVFASNLRYRLPAEPVIAVLAGAGLALMLGLG